MNDWQGERDQILSRARRVVVKIGSAVLATEQGVDTQVLEHLVSQLAGLHERGLEILLVSSGAVAAGRPVARGLVGQGANSLTQKQAMAAIGQSRLMHAYDQAFSRFDKVTAQILLTRDDLRSRERFLNARNTLTTLLGWKAIPVLNENDTVAVQELKFGDNDSLAALVVNAVEADLFVNLTSAQGVFDDNPLLNPDARLLPCVENIGDLQIDSLCRGKSSAGTGGMESKLRAARRAAQLGVATVIAPGKAPCVLETIFAGKQVGTWVLPEAKPIAHRKFWLAYNLDAKGSLVVDAGAKEALLKKGKSLLPAGILRVEGRFGVGALVRILDEHGAALGVGLCNYTHTELKKVLGQKSAGVRKILGDMAHFEAVHRDNMLLDAAL